MRKVTFSDGTEWEVRPLTAGQIRKVLDLPKKTGDDVINAMFVAVETAGFSLDKYESLLWKDFKALHDAIWAETYGAPEETKN